MRTVLEQKSVVWITIFAYALVVGILVVLQ
jgi:hypothetical protein